MKAATPGERGERRRPVLLFAFVMVVPYFLVHAFPPDEVEIDGYFMDWVEATVYQDTPDSENEDVSLAAYATKSSVRASFFYIATAGTVMNGADDGADGFYIFIDRDGDPGTGYIVRGLGADHMIAVVGWNGTAALTATYIFTQTAEQDDYGGFRRSSDPMVAFRGGEMEIGTGLITGPASEIAIVARHTDVPDDWSEVNFAYAGPAVRVSQHFEAPEVTAAERSAFRALVGERLHDARVLALMGTLPVLSQRSVPGRVRGGRVVAVSGPGPWRRTGPFTSACAIMWRCLTQRGSGLRSGKHQASARG